MDDAFNESVVTERKESLTFGISSVPTAQRRRLFVGEEDKVLRMVEHRLSPMMLRSSSARAGVANEASAGRQLPQFDERIFAAG